MSIEIIGKLLMLVGLVSILARSIVWIYSSKDKIERRRIDEILAYREEWGEGMCKWLIVKGIHSTDMRVAEIMRWYDLFGAETCRNLILRRISIAMTDKMVLLSLGKPSRIDNQAASGGGEKFRWVYDAPHHKAAYIWFINGKVTKIENLPASTHVHTEPRRGDALLNTRVRQKEQQLQNLSRRISSPQRAGFLARIQQVKKIHFLRGGRL